LPIVTTDEGMLTCTRAGQPLNEWGAIKVIVVGINALTRVVRSEKPYLAMEVTVVETEIWVAVEQPISCFVVQTTIVESVDIIEGVRVLALEGFA